jgi:hypothetical protein
MPDIADRRRNPEFPSAGLRSRHRWSSRRPTRDACRMPAHQPPPSAQGIFH